LRHFPIGFASSGADRAAAHGAPDICSIWNAAMIDEKYRAFLLQQLHTNQVRHSGRDFYTHLEGTHNLLQAWGNPEAICVAGLFHSIYGTRHFRYSAFPVTDRDVIRGLIGVEAEFLAYVFCVSDRREFLAGIAAQDIMVTDHYRNSVIPLSRSELTNLLEIEAANLIEQNSAGKTVLERLLASDISFAAKCAVKRHVTDLSFANRSLR
jgi:hypothetical protein